MSLPGCEHSGPVITVKALKVGYGEKVLLEHLDFEVRPAEVFVILGASGCGKSLLLKHLIGLYEPVAGEIWFGRENLVTARGDVAPGCFGISALCIKVAPCSAP